MNKFLALLVLFFSFIHAQTFEWVNIAPLDIQWNPSFLHSPVTVDNSGNPVCARLVNYREAYGQIYYGDIKIEKRNSSGLLLSEILIIGKADVSELIVDGEDNIICIGTYRDSLVIGTTTLIQSDPNQNSFILKTDGSGNFLWVKDGTEFAPEFGIVTALELKTSNNFLVGVTNWNTNANIYELGTDGNVVSIIEQAYVETISDIDVDLSGNIWATGFAFNGQLSFNGLDTIAPFPYNEYVVKYNSSGTAQWINFIQDITAQDYNIETDNSGNAYLSGNLFDSTSFGNLHANGPQWVYDYFVTKINSFGNYIWLRELPPGNTTGDGTIGNSNFLSCGEDGDTYITGFFRGEINLGNGVILTPVDYYDIFVINYNASGEVQWAKAAGSNLFDQGSGVVFDKIGNCYISGLVGENSVFDTIAVTGTSNNLYLARLKLENVVSVDDGLINSDAGIISFELRQNYPNPFNPSTTIRFAIPNESFTYLEIFNALGENISTLVSEILSGGDYRYSWNALGFPSGIYFYKLSSGTFTEIKKMILIK
jgi:hypothetical protein